MKTMASNAADRRPLQADVQDALQRIVSTVHPDKVILFGSAARDEATQVNDLDFLVIKQGAHRRRVAAEIYRQMIGVGWPVDIVVATPEDVARYGQSTTLIIGPALREGKLLYAA